MKAKRTLLLLPILFVATAIFITRIVKDGHDYHVTRVIDGDTVVLNSGERLRYIGIDTPELRHRNKNIRQMAEIARKYNEDLVLGQGIMLEYDAEVRDKYGRLLAYVFLKDGTFVNAELIQRGYALIMTIPPNVTYAELFLRLQQEAREARRGFWSDNYADFETMRSIRNQ